MKKFIFKGWPGFICYFNFKFNKLRRNMLYIGLCQIRMYIQTRDRKSKVTVPIDKLEQQNRSINFF